AKLYSFGIDVNEKEIIKPRALKKGDTIGVVAPARYIDGDFSEAVALIESRGYKVKLGETCFLKDNGFAGTPKQRADDVNRFFADDEVDAILCLRGGSGSMDMIGMLDYDMIKKHPKMFIGFSDITAVHSALYKKCGLVTVHGPMVSNLSGEMGAVSGYTVSQLFDGIGGNVTDITLPEGGELTALCCGTAQGRIVGGNLSLICRLIDTPYAVDARGNILVIEDTHESAESIRRKLEILSDSGVTDECAGIVFGQFTDSEDSDGESWKDVITDFAEKTGKPCIMGLPAGHENDNMFLPLGVTARMTADENGSGIELLESIYE
ncbi:MAG: LD-carboxypeptidase, partial [Oscillospiraceae bacterium]|nr:LD-carboxypeptidase [Oscillospiraceae bacterium]